MRKIILILVALFLGTGLFAQVGEKTKKKELKPALLVIDVQNEFMPMMSSRDKETAVQYINWSIWVFRKFDLPVIRVYHTTPGQGPEIDSEGFEFDSDVNITEDDPMVIKNFGNAFKKTELDSLLKAKGVNTIYITGLSATGCAIASYFGGVELDYNTFMVEDALLSQDADLTNAVEKICNPINVNTLLMMMEYTQQ